MGVVTRAEQFLLTARLLERQSLAARGGSAQRRAAGASSVGSLALQPTLLGRLVECLPLDIDASQLVLFGALHGLLDEAVLLAALRCATPMPLKREPNRQQEYERLISHYGPAHQEVRRPARPPPCARTPSALHPPANRKPQSAIRHPPSAIRHSPNRFLLLALPVALLPSSTRLSRTRR